MKKSENSVFLETAESITNFILSEYDRIIDKLENNDDLDNHEFIFLNGVLALSLSNLESRNKKNEQRNNN